MKLKQPTQSEHLRTLISRADAKLTDIEAKRSEALARETDLQGQLTTLDAQANIRTQALQRLRDDVDDLAQSLAQSKAYAELAGNTDDLVEQGEHLAAANRRLEVSVGAYKHDNEQAHQQRLRLLSASEQVKADMAKLDSETSNILAARNRAQKELAEAEHQAVMADIYRAQSVLIDMQREMQLAEQALAQTFADGMQKLEAWPHLQADLRLMQHGAETDDDVVMLLAKSRLRDLNLLLAHVTELPRFIDGLSRSVYEVNWLECLMQSGSDLFAYKPCQDNPEFLLKRRAQLEQLLAEYPSLLAKQRRLH